AKSVSEFWRRWHMTLGGWFRDYVYIPLGGNRKGTLLWFFNVLIVWMFTGLWHGAEWNFVLWGLSFAVLLVAEKALKNLVKQQNFWTDTIGHVYMVFVILVTFLLFHNTQLSGAWQDIAGLWRVPAAEGIDKTVSGYLFQNRIGILVIGVIGATPLPRKLWSVFCDKVSQKRTGVVAVGFLECVFAVALLLLCTAYLIDGSFNPFLYFRF
ncbi:MAG: MBOAT family protein, partial [Lachnospiraceae bacterium]|nr:MBOAT family protein [Lachnospiraceae bacterium]